MDHSMWEDWFKGESTYQDAKFEDSRPTHDEWMRGGGLIPSGRWRGDIDMYLHRANLLGLENPNGRQALAKAAMVVIAAVESAVRVFGPLPEPGHTSGEIVEWNREVIANRYIAAEDAINTGTAEVLTPEEFKERYV